MKNLIFCTLLSFLQAKAQVADARPASESQMPGVNAGQVSGFLSTLKFPYVARPVSPIDFRNSNRLASLIRAGNLYLSLQDAIDLAIENNLDIELQRFGPSMAQSDTLRAKGGGTLRGVPTVIRELPAGVGGPGSPLLTTVGGVSPITSVPSNSADLAPIQGQNVDLSILNPTPLSTGSRLPMYDPAITGTLGVGHQTTPETSFFLAGTNALTSNSVNGNIGIAQGFSTGTQIGLAFTSNRQNTNSVRNNYNPYTIGSLGLTITQPLLQGFGLAVNRRFIRIAQNDEKLSDYVFRQQLNDTVASIVRLYWDLVSLNEDVRVKRQALALAQKLYEDNKSQVEVGTLAPIEVKRAQAEVARSRQDFTNSSGLVLQQELILKTILTRRGTADPAIESVRVVPTDHIPTPGPEVPSPVQELVGIAVRNRPDLSQARMQIENSQISLKGSRNALLPELDLVGNVQNNGLSGQLNPAAAATTVGGAVGGNDPVFVGGYGNLLSQVFARRYPSYSIGLQLNIPLRNRIAQADAIRDELQLRQTQVREQTLENQIRLEVENALLNVQRARASYEAAVETRQLQEEALDAEQQRYSVGASTTYQVIQYQRDLAQARSTEVVTLGNYGKAKAALERSTGQTLETYHVEVDEAYRGQVSRPPSENVGGVRP